MLSVQVRRRDLVIACEMFDSAGERRCVDIFAIITVRKAFAKKDPRILLVKMSAPSHDIDLREPDVGLRYRNLVLRYNEAAGPFAAPTQAAVFCCRSSVGGLATF